MVQTKSGDLLLLLFSRVVITAPETIQLVVVIEQMLMMEVILQAPQKGRPLKKHFLSSL